MPLSEFSEVLWKSAFLGLMVYRVYEFTNLALIKNWPLKVVFIDILWGIFISVSSGLLGFWLKRLKF